MNHKPNKEKHFTERQARRLIGTVFVTQRAFSRVSAGWHGKVVGADNGGLGHWDIVIQWSGVSGEYVDDLKPYRILDWFTRDEMLSYLRRACRY